MNGFPLISCLCVTHKKPDMLKRVIRCFNDQSYPCKQLVIVYEEADGPTHQFIERLTFGSDTKVVKVDAATKLTLGELRNISVREANGSYVCQWDDDDWYDADRLTEQMNHIRLHGKSGCILSRWVVFDMMTQKAYLPKRYTWEGSILCKREVMLQNPYPPLSKGEDTSVIQFLFKRGELSIIDDMPQLYVYIYHGGNTWDYAHFLKILDTSQELSSELSEEIMVLLSDNA